MKKVITATVGAAPISGALLGAMASAEAGDYAKVLTETMGGAHWVAKGLQRGEAEGLHAEHAEAKAAYQSYLARFGV
jgi:hypothetical protein